MLRRREGPQLCTGVVLYVKVKGHVAMKPLRLPDVVATREIALCIMKM